MARLSLPLTIFLVSTIALLLSILLTYPIDSLLHRNLPVPKVIDEANKITYIGTLNDKVEHFQNIFYAEDTSGNNRFAPPIPRKVTPGSTIDATRAGAWCPQGTGDVLPFTSSVTNISEDCLSLQIARPQGTTKGSRLPVIVWLHGGGHALGSASDILYEPDGLVKQAQVDKQPVIYVGINYRLGFFGFATSKALVDAKHTNAGLRDQRAAFEWVRDNIGWFGGDLVNVTAIGQSVGASDIGLHLLSYGASRGVPFNKAIMMSGAPGLNFNSKPDLVANNTARIAAEMGCFKDGSSQSKATIDCLRKAPFETLVNVSVSMSRAARPPFGEGFFYPTIDHDYIIDRPSVLSHTGRFVRSIPLIASWVTNDGAWYAPPTTSTNAEVTGSFGLWLTGLSDSTLDRLLELYPLEGFRHMVRKDIDGSISPQYYRAAQLNRDLWFTCPVLDLTWQYVKHKGVSSSQVRLYEFNSTRYGPVFKMMGVPMWRVAHLSDIPYLFVNPELGGGADNTAGHLDLARLVSASAVRFAYTKDPTGSVNGIQRWPAAFENITGTKAESDSPHSLNIQLFGGSYGTIPVSIGKDGTDQARTPAEIAIASEKLFERCEFINSEQVREEMGV